MLGLVKRPVDNILTTLSDGTTVVGVRHFGVVKRLVDNMITLLSDKIAGDEYTAFLKSGDKTC